MTENVQRILDLHESHRGGSYEPKAYMKMYLRTLWIHLCAYIHRMLDFHGHNGAGFKYKSDTVALLSSQDWMCMRNHQQSEGEISKNITSLEKKKQLDFLNIVDSSLFEFATTFMCFSLS